MKTVRSVAQIALGNFMRRIFMKSLMTLTTMNMWIKYWQTLNEKTLDKSDFDISECMEVFFGLDHEYEVYKELAHLI